MWPKMTSGELVENSEPRATWNGVAPMEIELPYDSAIPVMGISYKELKARNRNRLHVLHNSNIHISQKVSVTRVHWWMNGCRKCAVVINGIFFSLKKKDILTHGTIMNLEDSIVWNTGWFFCEEPLSYWTHRNSKELEGRRNGLEMRNG